LTIKATAKEVKYKMSQQREPRFDRIGVWSEIKLQIVKKFAHAYSTIFSARRQANFHHSYIDAFSGTGMHISKTRGELVAGSPLNALHVDPPFEEYYFIDLDGDKVETLRGLVGDRDDIHFFKGDCNQVLVEEVFPEIKYEEYRRALCLLDPYGLHLDWKVIKAAAETKTIDIFLNFPIMDMNRNALWRHPEFVGEYGIARMNAFWGDDSWRRTAYKTKKTLFGAVNEKLENEAVVEAFRERLKTAAGFASGAEPLPMKNSTNAVVYYLLFASNNKTASRIIRDVFDRYR